MRRTLPLLAILAPSAVQAATLTVGPTRTYTRISSAVTAASAGDTIQIDAGTYTENVSVSKSLTFVGAGSSSTILRTSGSGSYGMRISGSSTKVSISGIEFQGRDGTYNERGLDIDQATVSMTDVWVDRHAYDGSAGVGIRIQNGANVTIDSSWIESNAAYSSNGANLYVDDSTVTITSSVIYDGYAAYDGAGIYSTTSTFTISDSWFDGNAANDDGGGIYDVGSTWTINDSTFSNNGCGDEGGGIRFGEGTTASLSTVDFDTNEAVDGGGLYLGTTGSSTSAIEVALDGVTFTSNDINYWGAGAAIYAAGASITSTNTTVTGHAPYYAWQYPTVYLTSANWDGIGDTFTDNAPAYDGANGGAMTITGTSVVTLSAAWFDTNVVGASSYGGAIYHGGSGKLTLEDAVFYANEGGSGGAVFANGSANVEVTGSWFGYNETSSGSGGGLQFNPSSGSSTLTIAESWFDGNYAASTTWGGGGVVVFNGIASITDTDFTDNTALYGGGLYFYSNADRLTLTNDVMCANTASGGGGGAFVDVTSAYSTLAFTNNVFAENVATTYGGGLFLDGTATTTTPAKVVNNTFLGNSGATGGGAYFDTYFSWVNNIVASTVAGNGVSAASSSYARSLTYGDWYSNTTTNLGSSLSSTTLDSTNVTGNPLIATWSADGDCTNDEFWPSSGSPVIDKGDPTIFDADGGRSDIGAYGGLSADPMPSTDADGDGYTSGVDCDDSNAAINPAATEVCNSVDDDCDGTADDSATDATTYYADTDADGYGNSSSTSKLCAATTGWVSNSTDCRDTDATAYPGAAEYCDSVDDDCDGTADDSAVDMKTWYTDSDKDGYGTPSSTSISCSPPSGTVSSSSDCDDSTSAVSPAATEVCDGVDNDCDGTTDMGVSGAPTYYPDADGDGYGDAASSVTSCSAPTGYLTSSGDCNDTSAAAYPGGSEVCDGIDNDCNGTADVGASDASTWYVDGDGDGYGSTSVSATACDEPSGASAVSTDCNDALASVSPGGTEVCNSVDDDCDGTADDSAADAGTWYADADSDGFGDASKSSISCSPPSGYIADGADCDDADATVTTGDTYYADADADGFGDPDVTAVGCAAPSGYVSDASDCDDELDTVSPDATELCDLVDNDCDGDVDESDAADATTWYADADADGWGDDATAEAACDAPSGSHVGEAGDCNDADALYHPFATETCTDTVDYNCDGSLGTDDNDGDGFIACEECDDSDAAIHPDAAELCNEIDDDCDGTVDEEAVDSPTWYADADGDGFGDVAVTTTGTCTAPSGYVSDSTDCNDADATYFPGALETCDSGLDTNCDGSIGSDDADLDGYIACDDCNDGDPDVNPAAPDVCNAMDDDCDGVIDEDGATFGDTYYADDDHDDHGDATDTVTACTPPFGYTDSSDDCDDSDSDAFPGADEVWYSGDDEACDGGDDYDQDGDGHQADLFDGDDCDDTDAAVNPEAQEIPQDGIDNDCDGVIDGGGEDTDTGDRIPDTDDGTVDEDGKGCNCDASGANAGGLWAGLLGLVGLVGLRRRPAQAADLLRRR